MPSLSGKFDPNIGVLINVGVAPANTLGNAAAPSGISVTAFPALLIPARLLLVFRRA
jgi:hypothetical protein